MDYNFKAIEEKWQKYWKEKEIYKVDIDHGKPKFYVLDMFPYPSGAGLHVGHPLGYIASDIYSRFKRLQGFNVLHPMGFDAFGLPAEQYAIQTGQHPALTTENNIKRYREQLDKIGFSFDWSREVRTCDPKYYKWTQWAFLQMFRHWYDNKTNKAEPIGNLIDEFEKNGTKNIDASCTEQLIFSAAEWKNKSEKEQQEILLNYRIAYLADTMVNWCPALGTVLANDEVKDGFSVRGGHPVVQKEMKQWSLRISAYAGRLLNGLDTIDWTESLKEMQRFWIGRSEGAEINFDIINTNKKLLIFTTRPDTIYGATFMVLAPEHEYVDEITTSEYKKDVNTYREETKKRTERERMAEVKKINGQFTGACAFNPFTKQNIQIWISDYVLAGYGTGAIMAVPAHDSRDYAFAKHFGLPITEVIAGGDISQGAFDSKDGVVINSEIINGLVAKDAIVKINDEIEKMGIGKRKINYRLRDAIFSRQRYWGEPFPIYFKDEIPYPVDEKNLPLELSEVDVYLPTEKGEPPLGRAKNWKNADGYPYELSTMPGFAGSSAYYLRYMDPHNDKELVSKKADEYWRNVDLYIGGAEHATGHLIYARFWNKFLFDLGLVCEEEPFKKLINQGMILGVSELIHSITPYFLKDQPITTTYNYIWCNGIYEIKDKNGNKIDAEVYYSADMADEVLTNLNHLEDKDKTKMIKFNIPIYCTQDHTLFDFISFKKWRGNFSPTYSVFVCKDGYWIISGYNDKITKENWYPLNPKNNNSGNFFTTPIVEKLSKSKLNVIPPDNTYNEDGSIKQEGIIEKYGADTLRMYEMFLGPLEQAKPWDTNGIEGVHKFLRKLWRLCHGKENNFSVSDGEPTKEELKILHKTIKKIREDIENFSFNTSVSAFMICVNEFTDLKCSKKKIIEPLVIILSPFAPHIAEELWNQLGNKESICNAKFPEYDENYLKENTFNYPVSFNGKTRYNLELPMGISNEEIQDTILKHELSQKWLDGKTPKKFIIVAGKIINVVV
ncbi:MAG: leucine--tRNA ligase [Bacteroidia bacterium]|nr:leucine--tRNA ligase [Bacteroidia bacterium]